MPIILNEYTGKPMSLLILGAGGLGQAVAEMAQMSGYYSTIAFLDDNPTDEKEALYRIIGKTEDAEKFAGTYTHAIPAFGNNQSRYSWTQKLKRYGYRLTRIIHQSAIISSTTKIGDGTIIRERVVISRGVVIGEGCLINIGVMIDHNVVVGDGCHLPMGCIVRNEIHIPELSGFSVGQILETADEV